LAGRRSSVALVPALLLALRNAYLADEKFNAWLHLNAPQR